MGIRETVNKNPVVTAAVAVILLVAGAVWIYMSNFGGGEPTVATGSGGAKQFYSVDDGATYFPDDYQKMPPFDKDGKPAVIAHVFKCLDDNTVFVAYLERYTPEAQKQLAELLKRGTVAGEARQEILSAGREVRAPGAGKPWVRSTDRRSAEITLPKCPKDGGQNIEFVAP